MEPYYGGSHKQFLEGLMDHVEAEYVLMQLPARKWKMRMQLSAPWFIKKINEFSLGKRFFDIVLLSTFVDVAVFKAMACTIPGWNVKAEIMTYFHENQFQYPDSQPKIANHQFTAINFTTALTSDKIGFNSSYNMNGFLDQCDRYLSKATDIDLKGEVERIKQKSCVLFPGIEFSDIDELRRNRKINDIPLIIWNHRWEHDKNPEEFFDVCYRLKEDGVAFHIGVLGQCFNSIPDCFKDAEIKLEENIYHFGYVEEKQDYYRMLLKGDYVVSTALHEFFGISVIEAVRAGCYPVLPDRLSYPELFDKSFLYGKDQLYHSLKNILLKKPRLSVEHSFQMSERFNWKSLRSSYEQWLNLQKK